MLARLPFTHTKLRSHRVSSYATATGKVEFVMVFVGAFLAAFWMSRSASAIPASWFIVILSVFLLEITFDPVNGVDRWSLIGVSLLLVSTPVCVANLAEYSRVAPLQSWLVPWTIGALIIIIAVSASMASLSLIYDTLNQDESGRYPSVDIAITLSLFSLSVLSAFRHLFGAWRGSLAALHLSPVLLLGDLLSSSTFMQMYEIVRFVSLVGVTIYVFFLAARKTPIPRYPTQVVPQPSRFSSRGILAGIAEAFSAVTLSIVRTLDTLLRILLFSAMLTYAFSKTLRATTYDFAKDFLRCWLAVVLRIMLPMLAFLGAGIAIAELGSIMNGILSMGSGRLVVPVLLLVSISLLGAGVFGWTRDKQSMADVFTNGLALAVFGLLGSSFITLVYTVLHVERFHIGPMSLFAYLCIGLGIVYGYAKKQSESVLEDTVQVLHRPMFSGALIAIFVFVFLARAIS